MPDLVGLIYNWWRQVLLLVLITTGAAAIIVFIIPSEYLGQSTALPAPPAATDRTGVFSDNLQALSSALGSPDDLDRVLGTASLDTVYTAVATHLDLANHYAVASGAEPLRVSAAILKKNTRVIKNDYGALQVKVWDRDKNLAAKLANAIMEQLQQIHRDLQTAGNAGLLKKINEACAEKKLIYLQLQDSLTFVKNAAVAELLNIQKSSTLQQIQDYEKLANEYNLMVNAKPEALIVIEKASAAIKPDKPERAAIIIGSAIISLFFGLLLALVLERRKENLK